MRRTLPDVAIPAAEVDATRLVAAVSPRRLSWRPLSNVTVV
jgi:hypothetical protein